MTDTPAPASIAPSTATGESLVHVKGGHRITDPGDASPLGHPEGSDFEPRQAEPVPYGVTEIVKPNP